jgi:hypothetical protein
MRPIAGLGLAVAMGLGLAQPVLAEVPVETARLKGQAITLHVHPFLTEQELQTLRLVMTNKQALDLFITSKGHSAIAMAPGEGFIRDNAPVKSAVALGDFSSAEEASAAAIAGCEAQRQGGEACVVVLEVGPAS